MSILPRRRADASSTAVLVIVCAGVVLASLDLFIVNVALPESHATCTREPRATSRGCSTPTRSSTRRCSCCSVACPKGAGASTASCSACRLHCRLGGLRRRRAACDARSSSRPAGGGRGTADADLARPGARDDRARAPPRRGPGLDGGRRHGRRAGPGRRRPAGGASWRWVFLVNVPIGIAALLAGWARLPRVDGHPVRAPDALAARWSRPA